MKDILGLDGIFEKPRPCMKRGCHFKAMPKSAYCSRHQSRQEIQDKHGPIIEERAEEGIVSKVLAQADEADDLAVVEDFQERERTEQHIDATAIAIEEEERKAEKAKGQVYQDAYRQTKAKLEAAIHVPLKVDERQVIRINGVPWILEEGMNSVPYQIKEAYENHQKMLAENTLIQKVMEIRGDAAKPYAYYQDVLNRNYRGEVLPAHDKASHH